MSQLKLKFEITQDGDLRWSQDGGCTWEILGPVAGNGRDGANGTNGTNGTNGVDGRDGVDGDTPYINEATGTWWIGTVDTHVQAEGTPADITVGDSSDIDNPDVPTAVTVTGTNSLKILHFHGLKGDPGEAPEITATRATVDSPLILFVDGVAVATIYDGYRTVQVDNVQVLGNNTTPLNLISGDNITITPVGDNIQIAANVPDAMVFKGSLGVGGTITALPVDGSANVGDTYKVITDGTYNSQVAKVGDLFICNGKTSVSNVWVYVPSGDEPSGTVTNVATGACLVGGPITSTGTIAHDVSGITAGSYGPTADVTGNDGTTIKVPQVTVDTYGHVTAVTERTYTSKNTTNVPTTKNELIYYDPSLVGNLYGGLFTQQLMYEGGIIVDNATDLARCKSDNDFTIQEIGTSWPTELISNNKYLAWTAGGGYSDEIDAASLLPGGITSQTNAFWYYNQNASTLDALWNDSYFARRACLYNPTTSATVRHDALYGFFASTQENDTVGCGFIGFGTTQTTDSDGTWCPTVELVVGGDPKYKDSHFTAFHIGLSIHKRKADTTADNREKYYPADTSNPRNGIASVPGFEIVGSSDSTVVSGTSVEAGKCVVKNTSLLTCPWSSGYYGPSYIRIRTEKEGNVITWYFSEILAEAITDLPAQTPNLKAGSKVQIDLDNYKVRYITSGMSAWDEFDCSSYSTYLDVLKNDAHFMFHQSSTPKGRVYNVTTLGHRLILDIDTDLVWQRSGNTWSVVSNTVPLDLFAGSRLNFNDVTKKLWYSNGTRIYQIGGSFS